MDDGRDAKRWTRRAGKSTRSVDGRVMELVNGLCEQVAIVHAGRVVASGTLDDVRADSTPPRS